MSSMFRYDPLDILDRAQKSADDSWDRTLNYAKKRMDQDQQMFDSSFKNDKLENTYGSDLFKTNSMNESAGLKAENESFVYGQALSPENQNARRVSIDNAYQSPAAKLAGDAAGAGIADLAQRNSAALDASKQFSGALGAQAVYGQSATNAHSTNVASDIASGLFDRANESLRSMGINMQVAAGPTEGTVVLVGADGRPGAPMPANEAAKFINDRTGVRAGSAQVYMDQAQMGQDKFSNQMALNEAKMAQHNNASQLQVQLLTKELEIAEKSGDPDRVHDVQLKINDLHKRIEAGIYGPTYRGAPPTSGNYSASSIVNGPTAQTPQADAVQTEAPATEQAATTDAVYQPTQKPEVNKTPSRTFGKGEVNDEMLTKYKDDVSAASKKVDEIKADWQRANSLVGRRSIDDDMRKKIKAALDEAVVERDRLDSELRGAKNARLKDMAAESYNPYQALNSTASATMREQMQQRYAK